VARCLEKDRTRRWGTAAALLEAARAALGGGPAAAVREVPAVAVHVAASPAGAADTDALMAQAEVIEAAEAALRGAAFALPLATAGTLLGVRPLEPDPESSRAGRAAAVAWARELLPALARPGVEVRICVHTSRAAVRDGAEGLEVAGGPICQVASWLPEERPGFLATPAVLGGAG
jgi:hypothetical protein